MKMDILLKEIINKYYPTNISYSTNSEEYTRTRQFEELTKTLNNYGSQKIHMDEYITGLNKQIHIDFRERMYGHLDRCLTYQSIINNNIRLNIDLSLLGPYFSIYYIKRHLDKTIEISPSMDLVTKMRLSHQAEVLIVQREITPEYQRTIDKITSKIQVEKQVTFVDYFDSINATVPNRYSLERESSLINIFEVLFKDELIFV